MNENLVIFGDHDQATIDQMQRCMEAGDAVFGVVCADGHKGYSQPIGGGVAYPEMLSISGVGYDVGCGVRGVLTNIQADDLRPHMKGIMNRIAREVSFGVGRVNNNPVDHPVLDKIRDAEFEPQRSLYDKACQQLGTVGSGNHFVDVMEDDQGRVWIMVHFGSRGYGHRTANGFMSMHRELERRAHGTSKRGAEPITNFFHEDVKDGEMDSPPVLAHQDSEIGQAYWSAYQLASEYAYAGRQVVTDQVLAILGGDQEDVVENHHNYLAREEHFGQKFWVVRKGCTPVFPGQRGMVGGSMGDISVVIEGIDSDRARQALYSTMHGAGRVMSRTKAGGKFKKFWVCGDRDCDQTFEPRAGTHPRKGACAEHPNATPYKLRRRAGGIVDWAAWKRRLADQGIEIRGGDAEESPEVYRRLQDVLDAHTETTRVVHTLRPMGVCMAGPDVRDPYKD